MNKIRFIIVILLCYQILGFGQTGKYLYNLDSSIKYYQQQLNLNSTKKDKTFFIETNLKLIHNYLDLPNYKKAEELLDVCKQNNNSSQNLLHYKLLSAEADIDKYQSRYLDALKKYLAVHEYYSNTNNIELLFKTNIDIAEFYRKIAEYKKSYDFIWQAAHIKSYKTITDTIQNIRFFNRAAAIYNETGKPDSCRMCCYKVIEISVKFNKIYSLASAYNELGFLYKNLNYSDSSKKYYQLAEINFKKINAKREEVSAVQNQIELLMHNDPKIIYRDCTILMSKKILDIINKNKLEIPISRIYGYIADSYFFKGDSINWLLYKTKHLDERINENLYDNKTKIKEIEEKYKNEKIQKEIKIAEANLNRTKDELNNKKKQTIIVLIFLIVFAILLVAITSIYLQRKKISNELAIKNKNQEVLIQEIHHRVKNNLQFISSLINMQMGANITPFESSALTESARRIKSMALVHEMLYSQNNENTLNIKEYITELTQTTSDLVGLPATPINFNLDITDVLFNTAEATALGMITSELISNSIKHAFKNIPQPEISIELKSNNQKKYTFVYKDNGIGLSPNTDNKGKLGMRLVDIFSRQLKGKFELSTGRNFCYTLEFVLN